MYSLSKEYNPAKIYNDSEKFDSDYDDLITLNQNYKNITTFEMSEDSALATMMSNFDSLCGPYLSNKQTQTMIYKLITKVNEKLEEVHVDLWSPHILPSLSTKTYVSILLYAKIYKL